MGIERDSFVGNPHRQDYVAEDDDLEFFSGDEIDLNPFVLQPDDDEEDDEDDLNPLGLLPDDPDLFLYGNYDIVTEDDEDFEPDDYEDYLSDSDYEYGDDEDEGSDESEVEQAFFSDSEQETPLPVIEDSDVQNKVTNSDSKISGDTKTNDMDVVD